MSESRRFGYVRVSTKEQHEDRQLDAMRELGIAERDIIIDKQSGKDFKREGYQTLKKFLRRGDVLYVKELDRLGRNKTEIMEEWRDITKVIGADIVVMDMQLLDTTRFKATGVDTLMVDLVLTLMSYYAEEERTKSRTRQAEGIAAAKHRGKHLGRPKLPEPKEFPVIYAMWKDKKISTKRAKEALSISTSSFYRLVKKQEK
jgi:DNA invertase Pin-like site-specific DNA recombinase